MKKKVFEEIENAEESMIRQLMRVELCKSEFEHEERFSSAHEAESVIREELEEAEEEMQRCRKNFEIIHASLRDGDDCGVALYVEALQKTAVRCAAELLQLGAMCQKGWAKKWENRKSEK